MNRPNGRLGNATYRQLAVSRAYSSHASSKGQNSKYDPARAGCGAAAGSGRWEQAFFNSMQAFPCGLGQRWVCANNVADHLPGGEVERALRRRTHGQRHRALRTETDALGRRFLARPHSYGLREQVDGYRFLSRLEFPITTKAIQGFQKFRLRLAEVPA